MAYPASLPLDSLHRVIVYLETEQMCHEEANDDRRFDAVYKHARRLREWLSDVDDGGPGDAAMLAENAAGAETR